MKKMNVSSFWGIRAAMVALVFLFTLVVGSQEVNAQTKGGGIVTSAPPTFCGFGHGIQDFQS